MLGAARCLFWGWQTGLLAVGAAWPPSSRRARFVRVALGPLARRLQPRLRLSRACCSCVIAVYQVLGNDSARAVLALSSSGCRWWCSRSSPASSTASPARSTRRIFFWSLRRRADAEARPPGVPVDLSYPYFGALHARRPAPPTCAAGAFYVGPVRWSRRGRSGACGRGATPTAVWARRGRAGDRARLGGPRGRSPRRSARSSGRRSAWLLDYIRRDTDPYRSGDRARSRSASSSCRDRIVLRVEPPGVPAAPLLREASLQRLQRADVVRRGRRASGACSPRRDGPTWRLAARDARRSRITVSAYLRRGSGVLAAARRRRRARSARRSWSWHATGSARCKVDEGLGLVTLRRAGHVRAPSWDDAPTRMPISRCPPDEAAAVEPRGERAGAAPSCPPDEAVTARARVLPRQLPRTRAIVAGDAGPARTALEDFLLARARGPLRVLRHRHRAAAAGGRHSGALRGRLRGARVEPAGAAAGSCGRGDAHSWALAWIDGAWRERRHHAARVGRDGGRRRVDAGSRSSDLWAWASFLFSRWRWSERQDRLTGDSAGCSSRCWPSSSGGCTSVAARRALARRGGGGARRASARARTPSSTAVERRLERRWGSRAPAGEPLGRVARRGSAAAPAALAIERRCAALLALHYRYRFDPEGLPTASGPAAPARAWLAEHAWLARASTSASFSRAAAP